MAGKKKKTAGEGGQPKAVAAGQSEAAQPSNLNLPGVSPQAARKLDVEKQPVPLSAPDAPVGEAGAAPVPIEPTAKELQPAVKESLQDSLPQGVQTSLKPPENPMRVLEAALFMSGQALGPADLAKLVGIAALGHVSELLNKLSAEYEQRGSGLEVVQEENGKWVMRVRAAYAATVRNFAGEAEISRHALRTLAYISRHDGIKKRDLFMRLGSTIYEDVAELMEKGFVSATPSGRTVSLKTTAKFRQYFNG